MIVAPLMVPIQGVRLSVVIGDRANLARSFGLVLAGAVTAVAIGHLVGSAVVNDVVAAVADLRDLPRATSTRQAPT